MFTIAIGLALLIFFSLHRNFLLHPKLQRAQLERLVRQAQLPLEVATALRRLVRVASLQFDLSL